MLQIFTYSTGLAFTGRSAACAPLTATRAAALSRMLFDIGHSRSGARLGSEVSQSPSGFRFRSPLQTLKLASDDWKTSRSQVARLNIGGTLSPHPRASSL